TDKWKRLANVPIQGSHFEGSVFAYQGQIVAMGGAGDGQVPLWRVSVYHPKTNSWTELSHSPIGRLGASAGVIGNKVYYIAGDKITPANHTTDGLSVAIGFLPDLNDNSQNPPPNPGPTSSIGSSADTYTRGGVNADTSFGAETSINVKAGSSDNAREGLI